MLEKEIHNDRILIVIIYILGEMSDNHLKAKNKILMLPYLKKKGKFITGQDRSRPSIHYS